MRFKSIDPSTEHEWCTAPESSPGDVDEAVLAAKNAFKTWSISDVEERAHYLRLLAVKMLEHAEYLGRIETIDSGKLFTETKFQAQYMHDYFKFYENLLLNTSNEPVSYTHLTLPTKRIV